MHARQDPLRELSRYFVVKGDAPSGVDDELLPANGVRRADAVADGAVEARLEEGELPPGIGKVLGIGQEGVEGQSGSHAVDVAEVVAPVPAQPSAHREELEVEALGGFEPRVRLHDEVSTDGRFEDLGRDAVVKILRRQDEVMELPPVAQVEAEKRGPVGEDDDGGRVRKGLRYDELPFVDIAPEGLVTAEPVLPAKAVDELLELRIMGDGHGPGLDLRARAVARGGGPVAEGPAPGAGGQDGPGAQRGQGLEKIPARLNGCSHHTASILFPTKGHEKAAPMTTGNRAPLLNGASLVRIGRRTPGVCAIFRPTAGLAPPFRKVFIQGLYTRKSGGTGLGLPRIEADRSWNPGASPDYGKKFYNESGKPRARLGEADPHLRPVIACWLS